MRTAELQAGRELDAEVARQVMGWGVTVRGDEYLGIPPQPVLGLDEVWPRSVKLQPVPHYSTDIAAAWEVFNLWPAEYRMIAWSSGRWSVHLTRLIVGQSLGEFDSHTFADTAPLAICLAALKAKDYEARLAERRDTRSAVATAS